MTSGSEFAKKELETDALLLFLDAYAGITGERLALVDACESPDFICARSSDELTGVELAQITRGKIDIHWDLILDGKEGLDPFEAQDLILHLISKKEVARAERYVKRVPQCILLLQLVDGSIQQIRYALDDLHDEFKSHGFSEIWIADYSGRDAYGDIELYGLFPARFYGFHERWNPNRKPYG